MAFDLFISYPHQDKAIADAACAHLEAAGIRCWIAPRDIIPGADWGSSIVEAIAGTDVMVLVFSQHANASEQIKREVERAVHRGMPIIPLRTENVPMNASLQYYLSTSHWLDAQTPPLEQHLRQLAVAVKELLRLRRASAVETADRARLATVEKPVVNAKAVAKSRMWFESLSSWRTIRIFMFGFIIGFVLLCVVLWVLAMYLPPLP